MQMAMLQSFSVHVQTFPVSWHVSHRYVNGNNHVQDVVENGKVDCTYFYGLNGARIQCVIEQLVFLQGAAKLSEKFSPCNHRAMSSVMHAKGETYAMPLYA